MRPGIKLVILSILFQISCSEICPIYKCSEYPLPVESCLFEKDDVYQLKSCVPPKTCAKESEKENMQYCVEYMKKLYPDEKCYFNEQCLTNLCVDNKCKVNTKCFNIYDCAKNQYCAFSKCVDVVTTNGTCASDYGCSFNHICNPDGFICMQMYSIETGERAQLDDLCKSGFSKDGYCAETESTATTTDEECTKNSDCPIRITFDGKQPEKIDEGICECSGNGKKYCSITTKNEVWQDYLKIYNKRVKKISEKKIYVAIERANSWGDPDIFAAEKKKEKYPLFKNVDECAVKYLLNGKQVELSMLSLLVLIFVLI